MKKLNILFVVNALESGGVEQVIINYVSHLKDEQYRFFLIYERSDGGSCLRTMIELGIECKQISEKKKKPIKNIIDTYDFITKNNIDIVHAHINSMNFVPLFAAWLAHVKIRISHAHNAIFEKGLKKIFRNFCKDLTKIFATKYIACGNLAGDYLYKEGILKRDFKILNNAIDINRFKFNERYKYELSKLYNTDGYFILGNIGRMSHQKNQVFLIKILPEIKKAIPKIKLVIVGEGELKKNIEDEITNLRLNNDVILVNNTKEIEKYYSYFDLMLLPSFHEGLPLVAIEAQCCNLPIIASDSITEEIKLSENVHYLSLQKKENWKNLVLKIYSNKNSRLETNTSILNSLYNIENEVKVIKDIYKI